jgi:acyl-coenzyme A synthetase/AMP-(fatty) acid ligase
MNVGLHLSKRAALNPWQEALVDEATALRFTFAALNEQADRAAHVLTECGLAQADRVAVLAFDGAHDALVADLRERALTDGGIPQVAHWLRVGADCPEGALDLDALLARAPSDPLNVISDGDDPLFIMYTSGTTGLPKGAIHTYRSVE